MPKSCCWCWHDRQFLLVVSMMMFLMTTTTVMQPVSAIRLCQPFQKVNLWKYQFVFVEVDVDKVPIPTNTTIASSSDNTNATTTRDDNNGNGLTISFFAFPRNETDGSIIDPTDDWGMANMAMIYKSLKDVKFKVWYDYDNSTSSLTGFETTIVDARTNQVLSSSTKIRTSCSIMLPGYGDVRQQARAYCDGILWPPNNPDHQGLGGGRNKGKVPKYLGLRLGYSKTKLELCPDTANAAELTATAALSAANAASSTAVAVVDAGTSSSESGSSWFSFFENKRKKQQLRQEQQQARQQLLQHVGQPQPPPHGKQLSVALCVRSFQSTFFGTNEVAIQPYHVLNWLSYHINIGFTRFYLYERVPNDLKNYLEPYLVQNPQYRQYIDLQYIPYLTNATKLFTHLVTQAYVFDQIMTMQSCFSKARSEGYDLVLHIDYDEYVHTKTPHVNIFETFYNDLERNKEHHHSHVSLERCNIRNVQTDPPVEEVNLKTKSRKKKKKLTDDANPAKQYKHACLWGKNDNNVKSAFNVTHMKLKGVAHNVHVYFCDPATLHFSKDLYLTHLPDQYVSRTHSSSFLEFLHLPSTNKTDTTSTTTTIATQQQQLQQGEHQRVGVITTTFSEEEDDQYNNMMVTKIVAFLLVGSFGILKLLKSRRKKRKRKRTLSSDSLMTTKNSNHSPYDHHNEDENIETATTTTTNKTLLQRPFGRIFDNALFARRAGRTHSRKS